MSVRLLRRLTDTACGRPLGRCLRQKGVSSPSGSSIFTKTRTQHTVQAKIEVFIT